MKTLPRYLYVALEVDGDEARLDAEIDIRKLATFAGPRRIGLYELKETHTLTAEARLQSQVIAAFRPVKKG